MRGDGVHEYRRGVRGLAAGHVDAHAVQRCDLLTQQGAVFVAVAPALARGFFLRFVVTANTLGSGLERTALLGGNAVECRFEFCLRQLQRTHVGHGQCVKARGVLQHGGIATGLHVGQDVGHTLLNGSIGVGRPVQAGLELLLKIGRSR